MAMYYINSDEDTYNVETNLNWLIISVRKLVTQGETSDYALNEFISNQGCPSRGLIAHDFDS